jgi:MFS family permease
MKAILQNKALVTLGIAETISNIGNWITMLAVWGILIFRGDGSIAQSSAIMLAGLGPMLVFSPLAGWLSDRFDRKWLMIGSQILGSLPVIALFFTRNEWLIYALLAIQSAVLAVGYPARNASIPALVEESQLTQANAFLQQLASMMKVVAPALAGALVGFVGPYNAMVIDIASFFVAAVILFTLPALRPDKPETVVNSESKESRYEGSPLTVLRRSFPLQLLFATMFIGLLMIMGFDVLGSVFVRDVLAGDEAFFGMVIGLVGLGQVLSVLWLMTRPGTHTLPWRDLSVGLLLLTAICLGCAFAFYSNSTLWARIFVGVGVFVGGMGNGIMTVQVPTLLQRLAPRAILGQLGGLLQSTLTAAQLIAILGLPLIIPGTISMGHFYIIASVGIALLALFVAYSTRYRDTHSSNQMAEPV